jgi:hypothetical protein
MDAVRLCHLYTWPYSIRDKKVVADEPERMFGSSQWGITLCRDLALFLPSFS